MNTRTKIFLLAAVLATTVVGVFANGQLVAGVEENSKKNNGFTDEFFTEDCDFASTGSNRFFILEPGWRLVFSGEGDQGEEIGLTVTVQDRTRVVDGVETRIVVERHVEDGELVEVSRNYFAMCKQTSSMFYYGEEVDNYVDGEIVNHNGSWLAGENGAKAGIIMPGTVLLGSKYQQETAPGAAMDRGQIVSMNKIVVTPAGTFENVLKIKETTPLEPNALDFKYHAAGIGLIQDNEIKLEEYGFIE